MLAVGLATTSALLATPGARAAGTGAAAAVAPPQPTPRNASGEASEKASGDASVAEPPPAAALPPTAPKTKIFPKLRAPSLLHKNQFGIAVMPGIGFRVIAPYKEMVSCGEQAKRVCTGRLPFFLDVQPSFGFAEHWDVIVDLRFGHDVTLVGGQRQQEQLVGSAETVTVVERQGEDHGLRVAQLGGQRRGQVERLALLVGALLGRDPGGHGGGRPGVRGQRVGADVAAHERGLRPDGQPLGLGEIGQLAAGRVRALDAGVDAKNGHGICSLIEVLNVQHGLR